MKSTPEMRAAGLTASYRLRDSGDPARGLKPVSFTGNPSAHVEAILEAGLALVPKATRGRSRNQTTIGGGLE